MSRSITSLPLGQSPPTFDLVCVPSSRGSTEHMRNMADRAYLEEERFSLLLELEHILDSDPLMYAFTINVFLQDCSYSVVSLLR